MNRNNSWQKLATLSVAVAIAVAMGLDTNKPAQAGSNPILNRSLEKISQGFTPPDRGAPPRTADGGSRGCGLTKAGEKGLTALTPGNSLPLTVNDRPTFFFYVPQSAAQNLKFTLMDEKDQQVIYSTKLPVPTKSGILSFSLPTDAAGPLEMGKMYHWYVVMACDLEDQTADITVDGWVERTQLNSQLREELKNASPKNRAAIYARNSIWHEAMSSLAQQLRNNPDDPQLQKQWQEFLNSVQLGEFAKEPLLETSQISQE